MSERRFGPIPIDAVSGVFISRRRNVQLAHSCARCSAVQARYGRRAGREHVSACVSSDCRRQHIPVKISPRLASLLLKAATVKTKKIVVAITSLALHTDHGQSSAGRQHGAGQVLLLADAVYGHISWLDRWQRARMQSCFPRCNSHTVWTGLWIHAGGRIASWTWLLLSVVCGVLPDRRPVHTFI